MNTKDMGNRDTGTRQAGRAGATQDNAGWSIFSYLVAGMVAYGLIGWLVATVTHIPLLLPLSALAGLVVAVAGIVYKYGRS
jgi:ATP synthase protein I